ncbi:MAG: neutral/alkaline non-lysosomal ceramidase N-terminal domain-containing protein [Thermoguttaceae bacterium]
MFNSCFGVLAGVGGVRRFGRGLSKAFLLGMSVLVLTACVAGSAVAASGEPSSATFRAGTARKNITPEGTIWMTGFARRKGPSVGVLHDIWVKALALEDAEGGRVVFITTDLIGLPRSLSETVATRVKEKHHLDRRQLLFNSSHTHGGPAIWPELCISMNTTPEEQQCMTAYRKRLTDSLVEVIDMALAEMKPATLAVGHGSVGFAVNRRVMRNGTVGIGANPDGPVDHDVPVLKIASADGKLIAVLFGYACHNTSLVSDCREIHGDYAGFAQSEIEKEIPGVNAMFMILCGGDQNAAPRGKLELAKKYGKDLADEVRRVLAGDMKTIASPKISTAYEEVNLDMVHQDRSVFERELNDKNLYRVRRARHVLAEMDSGKISWQVPEPIHVVRLGGNVVLVAMGSEVVIDYALRLKREYQGVDLIVAGYSNSVRSYIPSKRVLNEGGYEGVDNMFYCKLPGAFDQNIEETLVGACHRLLAELGVKPTDRQAKPVSQ